MFVNYEKLAQIIACFLPNNLQEKVKAWGYQRKISQNLSYINKNKIKVLKKLKNKIKKEKLNVAFYVYDEAKWKCQSLYDLMQESNFFTPYILATKNSANENSTSFQPKETVQKVFDFFRNKNMQVILGYDIENEKFIPTKGVKPCPDIIIYQHPWFVETSQNAVRCSEFALTYYIPYFLPTSISQIEYYLRFHQYVENFYVLDESTKELYSNNMQNKGANLRVVGHPQLDYFYLNKDTFEDENYVIYAPHWSIDDKTDLKWGTFLWNCEFMLKFAQEHPEYNWVFKPHPNLKQILKLRHWSDEKIIEYWNEWKKVGIVHESGDYSDLFLKSKLMITDSGSFQTEYFMTQKPCVYLKSENGTSFNSTVQNIVDNYYTVENLTDLETVLKEVLINNNDYMKIQRLEVFENCKLKGNYAAKNIIDDILKTLEVEL